MAMVIGDLIEWYDFVVHVYCANVPVGALITLAALILRETAAELRRDT